MLYNLNSLKRYNNIPRIKQESLSEHLLYTSILMAKLLEQTHLSIELKYTLLSYSLVHDIQELYTGDIPHNVKRENSELKSMLTDIEIKWLEKTVYWNIIKQFEIESSKNKNLHKLFKLADYLQVMMYCNEEIKFGNQHEDIHSIYENSYRLAEQLTEELISMKVLKHTFKHATFLEEVVRVTK